MKKTRENELLGTIDLISFFHQHLLPTCVRDFFVFSFRGKDYRMRVLPMGWTLSPAIAQSILAAASHPHKPLVCMGDVLADGAEFDPLPKSLQHRFDVGETQEPCTSPTYLGVTVCTRSRTVSICNKTREKILDLSKNKSYTLRAIWRAVGSSNTPTMCWARSAGNHQVWIR